MARTEVPQNLRPYMADGRSLGLGATREAFDLGDGTVLKVDWNGGGTLGGCNAEAAIWEAADSMTRQFLAPVIASGDGWLVMPKCAMNVTEAEGEAYDVEAEGFGVIINDLHPMNLGRMADGTVVCIDYAAGFYADGCDGCGWCSTCEADYAARVAATAV